MTQRNPPVLSGCIDIVFEKKENMPFGLFLFVEYFSFVLHKVVTRLKKESDKKAGMEEKYEWL